MSRLSDEQKAMPDPARHQPAAIEPRKTVRMLFQRPDDFVIAKTSYGDWGARSPEIIDHFGHDPAYLSVFDGVECTGLYLVTADIIEHGLRGFGICPINAGVALPDWKILFTTDMNGGTVVGITCPADVSVQLVSEAET